MHRSIATGVGFIDRGSDYPSMGSDSEDCRLPRVRIDTDPEAKARMRCSDCGATFPRSEARLPAKGTLVCPECDSRAISDVDG